MRRDDKQTPPPYIQLYPRMQHSKPSFASAFFISIPRFALEPYKCYKFSNVMELYKCFGIIKKLKINSITWMRAPRLKFRKT
jgi:hypothetical protein